MSKELDVCVVDDDQYYNSMVKKIVENAALENGKKVNVHSYNNGPDCMQNTLSGPDLVFLDFYLSTNNDITQTGLDVLKQMKAKHPETKVVFMSQEHDWEKFKDDLIAEGAMDFIKKDDDLPENINKILKKLLKK